MRKNLQNGQKVDVLNLLRSTADNASEHHDSFDRGVSPTQISQKPSHCSTRCILAVKSGFLTIMLTSFDRETGAV
jgi:hypothetical protein